MKTASTNSPWAYTREGLLSEGYLRQRFGGLIFGKAYYRNFTVFLTVSKYQEDFLKALYARRRIRP